VAHDVPGRDHLRTGGGGFRKRFSADANNYILQARTWQRHDVGTTPGFDGSVEKALRSIKARVLYMPSETDLYFPITDARYEQALIPRVTFAPIPSLWGTPLGPRAIRQTCGSSTIGLPRS
jgi:homoserine O-acetyltransferase